MKTIYFCVVLSLLAGCGSTALIGKYRTTDSNNFVQVNFEFKPDSVLEVTFWSDMSGESKKIVKWYSKGDTVYTPNELAGGNVFSYELVKNEAIQNFQIQVYDKYDNAGINDAHITVNGDVKPLRSEGNGLYKVDAAQKPIKTINVKYLSQQHKILIDHNEIESSNELKIYFDFKKSTNDFSYSQSWVFKNKKLHPLDSGHPVLTKRK
jgi:hypothetical protein